MLHRRFAGLRFFKFKSRTRNHATYTYSKPPPGSEHNQTGKNTSKEDINFNIDRIAASLVSESKHKRTETENEENKNTEHKNEENNETSPFSEETLTTVANLEDKEVGSDEPTSIFSKINLPLFTEIDFDYIEISLNRERIKDWHHEVLKKNELEYFGTFVDGERYVSTHGHWKQQVKSCLLDLLEPSIIVNKGESHEFRVIKMVSFEPEEIIAEELEPKTETETVDGQAHSSVDAGETDAGSSETNKGINEKNNESISASDDQKVGSDYTKLVHKKPPIPQPKIRFKRRKYDTSIIDLDKDAPIFEFRIKEDEEAHRLLGKVRELAKELSSLTCENSRKIFTLLEEYSPELARKIEFVYDSAWFGASLALQTLYLISQGNLFVPEETCQTSNAWNNCCEFSKNSRTSIDDNFNLTSPDVHLQKQIKHELQKSENCEDQIGNIDIEEHYKENENDNDSNFSSQQITESELEFKEENYEEYVELTETEIVSLSKPHQYNREEDYYYLVHYQLIYQVSKLPSFLTAIGFVEPEYFYHTFVLFNPKTNVIQIVRKGIDDDAELKLLRDYLGEGNDCEYSFVNSKPEKVKYCRKYFSSMMLRPTSDNSTCYVSTYSDENSKDLGWERWFSRAAMNKGIQMSHNKTNFSNNPAALSGTAIEKLLKFEEANEDD